MLHYDALVLQKVNTASKSWMQLQHSGYSLCTPTQNCSHLFLMTLMWSFKTDSDRLNKPSYHFPCQRNSNEASLQSILWAQLRKGQRSTISICKSVFTVLHYRSLYNVNQECIQILQKSIIMLHLLNHFYLYTVRIFELDSMKTFHGISYMQMQQGSPLHVHNDACDGCSQQARPSTKTWCWGRMNLSFTFL